MRNQESIMSSADLKRLLTTARGAPVNCAVGVVDVDAVILLSKVKNPKALEAELKHSIPSLKLTAFGTATADIKTVHLTLNRSSAGLQKRIVKAIKGTGYTKVVINGESSEEDSED